MQRYNLFQVFTEIFQAQLSYPPTSERIRGQDIFQGRITLQSSNQFFEDLQILSTLRSVLSIQHQKCLDLYKSIISRVEKSYATKLSLISCKEQSLFKASLKLKNPSSVNCLSPSKLWINLFKPVSLCRFSLNFASASFEIPPQLFTNQNINPYKMMIYYEKSRLRSFKAFSFDRLSHKLSIDVSVIWEHLSIHE